ncbi:hypothetical protein ASG29_00010 [Sphingomonas sp. Leaf412]|uniref:hypothetical protein n=1 Tax=Sphingomonas sp. Leaf412 TaxID=1736370 RepID=UPI0006F29473|nr:hypothetical protein [Sphingomonas sp. Leaf412]KQT34602.1 hypothetical protein ASG29_00010 [Sphingomonas sp. Leaf412]
MERISTAQESLARLDARIAALSDQRHKAWLTTYRNHFWGEVTNDVEAVMATMSPGPIQYSFGGHPFMNDGGTMAQIRTWQDTKAMYDGVVSMNVRMAGPFDEERVFFDEHGLSFHAILSAIYPGVFLASYDDKIDAEGLYIIRWLNVTTLRFDKDGLMMGEDILNGAPILVQQVPIDRVNMLIDGPIDLTEMKQADKDVTP